MSRGLGRAVVYPSIPSCVITGTEGTVAEQDGIKGKLHQPKVSLIPFILVSRDTAGQERFRTITTAYYRGAMGIMLVYDITNEKSFDNIRNWIRNIEEHASADVEKMILGNKCDVNDKRQVSKERGEKLALDYGIKFMETSAKANINVENAFFTLARDIKAKMDKKLEGNSPQGSSHGVKITVEQQKRTSFFRCSLL